MRLLLALAVILTILGGYAYHREKKTSEKRAAQAVIPAFARTVEYYCFLHGRLPANAEELLGNPKRMTYTHVASNRFSITYTLDDTTRIQADYKLVGTNVLLESIVGL